MLPRYDAKYVKGGIVMPQNIDFLQTEFPFGGTVKIDGIDHPFTCNVPNMTILEAIVAAYASHTGANLDASAMASRVDIRMYDTNKPGYIEVAIASTIEHRALENRLISFFEANPYTVNTARQIAIRLGEKMPDVERELQRLVDKHFIQKISYPGSDVFRHIPQRLRSR